MKGWKNSEKVVSDEELDHELHHLHGFFQTSMDSESKKWTRNFHELRQRDLTLFCLGEVKGKKIIDIGCFKAEYLLTVAKMGAEYVGGQDLCEDAVKTGRLRLGEENIEGKLVVGDAAKLDFPDNYFDIAFSCDVFEHISLEVKEKVISEVYRVLKPGGKFVIKTPNLSYLKTSIILKRILNLVMLKSPFVYIPHTNNNPDNEHHGLTTYSELENLLESNFFHTPEITYVPFVRKRLPKFVTKLLYGKKCFTECIIISTRKSIFLSMWE
tara:strand:+ start:193 stop:999 length:807 start_codon:yes stop_codon:yes gene_type:complete